MNNKESKKRPSTLSSLMFIGKFMKQYWFGLIFVVIFIVAATYFQVETPKLIGNTIDNLISYVGEKNGENIQSNIAKGKGLTQDQKDFFSDKVDSTTAEKIETATPEELKTAYDFTNLKNEVYAMDDTSIMSDKGYSQEQLDKIKKSDVLDDKQKNTIVQMNKMAALTIKRDYVLNQGGYLESEKEASKKMTSEELDRLYNLVGYRNYIISLDTDAISTEAGLSDKQLDYIENNTRAGKYEVYATQKLEIKKLSNSDLKEAYKAQKIEFDSAGKYDEFIKGILLLILAYVLLALTNVIYNVIMAVISGKTTRDMRKGLFGKIEELSIRFFDQSNSGDLLSRFTNDIDNITQAMNQSLVQMLTQLAMLVGIVIMMFIEDQSVISVELYNRTFEIHHFLVYLMLGFALIAVVLATFIIRKAKYYLSRQQGKLGELNGYIDERISGQKVIISYGLEEETLEEFQEFNKNLRKTSTKGQLYSGVLMPLMQGIGLISLGTLVFYGSGFVAKDMMTIGLLTAFIQYSQRFFGPLAQLVSQYNMLELGITGAARVKEVYDEKSEIVDSPNAQPIDGIKGKVSLKNVNFGYYEDKPVLKDINIEVKKGEMVALVGPTGSGKTTVMNLMNRFYDINSGEIEFDDIPIKDITLNTLRKNVGIVLQESIIFSGTVKENIAYGKLDATDEEVIEAAKTANIHDFIMTLENGYETQINNNTSAFSTGQKQLMSIARTILTDPDLLILDEATSNVDTVTEAKIQKAMENVLKGRTSFVIAHRLKTILNADEIIVLKDGEIIEQGNHQELLTEDGFYAELYKNQFVIE